jgi:hypothetical protein
MTVPNNVIKQSGRSAWVTVHPASRFVTGDTDAAPQSASFHTRDRGLHEHNTNITTIIKNIHCSITKK